MARKLPLFLAIVFIVAFVLRLAAILALRNLHNGPDRVLGADGLEYDRLGTQVAAGNGYCFEPGHPTSFRAPGFPLLLAGIFEAAGHNYVLVYLIFCAIGAGSCVLTYAIASELMDERLARWAAVLSIVYVPHIYFATEFDTENLFILTLALSTWLLLQHLRTRSPLAVVLSGLFLGWAILTRPFALLLVPLFALVITWNIWRRHRRFAWLAVSTVIAASAAVVAPWTVRNFHVHHHFVAVATNGGSTFYGGNNDRVLYDRHYYGGWISTVHLPGRNLIDAAPSEYAHDQVEWQLGKQWVKGHLASLPLLGAMKLGRLILPDIGSRNMKYVGLQVLGYTPFLCLYLIAWACMLRRPEYRTPKWCLMHGILLATVITSVIFWGSPRFRDANTPVLMLYASIGLSMLEARLTILRAPKTPVAIAAAADS